MEISNKPPLGGCAYFLENCGSACWKEGAKSELR